MPKFRKLWTKTIDSFDFNEMPDDFARVVWLLLPLILDSEGRGIDLPTWVCARMFPLRQVDPAHVKASFDYFESRRMIVRYKVDGRSYFYCANWATYQSGTEKESPSLLPPPPSKENNQSGAGQEQVKSLSGVAPEQVGAAASASASESVNESVNEFESSSPPPKISGDWRIRVFCAVTGMMSFPGTETEKINPALDGLYAQHNRDENALIEYLKPYYAAWLATKSKYGQSYRRTNCGWLYDWAVAGEIPKPAGEEPVPDKGKKPTLTAEEQAEWKRAMAARREEQAAAKGS